jgi:hypothetical protein
VPTGCIQIDQEPIQEAIVNLTLIAGEWLVTREEIKTGR